MRVTTWNVNGLRATLRKGFEDHLARVRPDVLLFQRCRSSCRCLGPRRTAGTYTGHPAKKKGYTGVAVWSRKPMRVLGTWLGDDDDDPEGERNICKLADGFRHR